MLQHHVTHCIAYDKAGQTQMLFLKLTLNSVSRLQFTVICSNWYSLTVHLWATVLDPQHKHGGGINLLTIVRATLLQ